MSTNNKQGTPNTANAKDEIQKPGTQSGSDAAEITAKKQAPQTRTNQADEQKITISSRRVWPD